MVRSDIKIFPSNIPASFTTGMICQNLSTQQQNPPAINAGNKPSPLLFLSVLQNSSTFRTPVTHNPERKRLALPPYMKVEDIACPISDNRYADNNEFCE